MSCPRPGSYKACSTGHAGLLFTSLRVGAGSATATRAPKSAACFDLVVIGVPPWLPRTGVHALPAASPPTRSCHDQSAAPFRLRRGGGEPWGGRRQDEMPAAGPTAALAAVWDLDPPSAGPRLPVKQQCVGGAARTRGRTARVPAASPANMNRQEHGACCETRFAELRFESPRGQVLLLCARIRYLPQN
jgi:hypothetical protein